MRSRRVAGAPLDFAAIRAELEVPGDFAAPVLAEAEQAARTVSLPDEDATEIPFVTIDPTGSRDLDQALHIAATADGFVVSYAIADVAAFVAPGGEVDLEAHRRGETFYLPDARAPLHPFSLSEGAASLLPGELRPALVWGITLASDGNVTGIDVRRACVRSTAQLDYTGAQHMLATATLPEAIEHLPRVGELRMQLARKRHAINLDMPEQVVEDDGHGGLSLTLRETLPIEEFNAQISLLTGMCAATLMLRARVGVLRTIPAPQHGAVDSLRRAAHALNIDWPSGALPGDVLSSVDRGDPRHVAFVDHAASLLRGAAYTVFDGSLPDQRDHSGIGAPYAHVTAPLRRLVDRVGTEICLAISADQPVPAWARDALPALPAEMLSADRRAHNVDRAVVDATEAWLLRDRVGEVFPAVVIDADEHSGTVVLDEPAVRARCTGANLAIGTRARARLIRADVETREVRFAQE